jgi:hypothetical protein
MNAPTRLSECPRIALLTWFAPDARLESADALRRIVRALPADRVAWCSMRALSGDPAADRPPCAAFIPRLVHWRLSGSALQYAYTFDLQARFLARRMARWLAEFRPQVLWVLGEAGVVSVGRHLCRRLKVPLHVSVHGAPELAAGGSVPRLYAGRYRRHVRRLLKRATSFDAVSAELVEHLQAQYRIGPQCRSMVLPPSLPRTLHGEPARPARSGTLRRIAACGPLRVAGWQWREFLDRLAALPLRFEMDAFVERSALPSAPWPANVEFRLREESADPAGLVRQLSSGGYDAGYLGLWREPARVLYARTVPGSPLAIYAAAALPVIVDAPGESVAWRLVRRQGAGVLLGEREQRSEVRGQKTEDGGRGGDEGLRRMFGDEAAWRRMAEGSARLCHEEFDLETNAGAFVRLLQAEVATAEGGARP